MTPCDCSLDHPRLRLVLTGGPGAGKTAVLELVRRTFCEHVRVLPEAASMLFGGGFPRRVESGWKRAAQRAIFAVQRELERALDEEARVITVCDRGTLDGLAYWPGSEEELMQDMATTRERELGRYDAVIHLRTPSATGGYDHSNRLRVETALEARAIDDRILHAWREHPRRTIIESQAEFMSKATLAISALRASMPPCCQRCLIR